MLHGPVGGSAESPRPVVLGTSYGQSTTLKLKFSHTVALFCFHPGLLRLNLSS
jgi:hypothetical protein